MSDVNNPLCGEQGATAIFGPQKGVQEKQIASIDHDIGRYAALIEEELGRSANALPGAGAAGGLGYAMQLLGAQFRSGAEVVADAVHLDRALAGAHWLITGEGRSDAQTLLGKTPYVAAARARARHVPASLLSGGIDRAALPQLSGCFAGCFSLAFGPVSLELAVREGAGMLADRAEQMALLWQAARGNT
jgi:glycerate kinase